MPVSRISSANSVSEPRRRRSSHLLYPVPTVKPGVYGPQHRIAFAPNVTPGTFIDPESLSETLISAPLSVLFPPSEKPAQPTRKRHPPGKRPSQGYIPRPPNAFMLFRADFVKQRHVPGSIETNHGSLSKIIGNCWRQLPLEEKHYWEQRAKEEKQQHKIRHPDYRFRPVHNKNKNKDSKSGSIIPGARRDKPQQTREEEIRCDTVAALLLEGKKGDELAQAVKDLDRAREAQLEGSASSRASFSSAMTTPPPFFNPPLQPAPHHASGLFLRRPSSVPLPGDAWLGGFGSNMLSAPVQYSNTATTFTLPQVPFFGSSRPVSPSPITGISFAAQQQQQYQERLLLRRPSSAQPMGVMGRRSWATMYGGYNAMPFLQDLGIENPFAPQHDQLPDEAHTAGEPDYALFNNFSFSQLDETQLSSATCTVPDGSLPETTNVGPHDLPPTLNLSIDPWTPRDTDPALNSATSIVSSSSTTTISSHESSPAPSDMYAPDNAMFTGQHIYLPTTIDANYNMNFTPFDISPLDPLSMPMGMEPSNPDFSFDAVGMQGMMDDMENLSSVLHAPKPLLANERTPTKTMFGEGGMGDYSVL